MSDIKNTYRESLPKEDMVKAMEAAVGKHLLKGCSIDEEYLSKCALHFGFIESDEIWEMQAVTIMDIVQISAAQLQSYLSPLEERIIALEAENKRLKEALEAIAENEGECCQRCEGNGRVWADGRAHHPNEDVAQMRCGKCGGEGRIYQDLQSIAADALNP